MSHEVGTLIVSALVGWIAWQQYQLKQTELASSLFDRRFEIYDTVLAYLVAFAENKTRPPLEKFATLLRRAECLFGDEICDYMKVLLGNARELALENEIIDSTAPGDPDRTESIARRRELKSYFGEQVIRSRDFFLPYLKLSTKKVSLLTQIENAISRLP